jgi:hypothetical protein
MYQATHAHEFTARGEPNPTFAMIERALETTQEALGVERDARRWMYPVLHAGRERAVYQTANRLALQQFLRRHGINAILVFLLFLADPGARQPADEAAWKGSITDVRARLGLSAPAPDVYYVLLDAEQEPLRHILSRRDGACTTSPDS